MDHKSWPWKKKSTEKTIVETDKVDSLSLIGNREEIQKFLAEKAELENDLKNLNEMLSSVLAESSAKDDLVKKHENVALEAIAGWKKTEAEATSIRQKLDETLLERVKGEERLTHLDAALKECTQQLRFVLEEQEQKIHDAVTKTSKEYEKNIMVLEMKLTETFKKLTKSDAEKAHVTKVLLAKENMIESLNRQMTQAEADINALMARIESKEKENASLKYEIRVLERELEIRNEEREFNHRVAEASQKQHLENVRKLAKLESECQRLRLLVRKKLPGPSTLAKMKTEAEILGRDLIEIRRRKVNASPDGVIIDSEKINNLTDQLCVMEEENKNLREALNKKISELQFSRNMYSRTASKLLEVESHLEESSKGHRNMEPSRSGNASHEISVASISDIDNDDKVSCAESWASALISELEHFKNRKQKGSVSSKNTGALEVPLMEDFVEMEKLALVSVDNPPCSSPVASVETNAAVDPLGIGSNGNSLEVTDRRKTLVSDCLSSSCASGEIKSQSIDKLPSWLRDIMRVVFEHKDVAERNPDGLLEDIRKALSSINHPSSKHFVDVKKRPNHHEALDPFPFKSEMSWKPSEKYILEDTPSGEPVADLNLQSGFDKSVCRIIELVERIDLQSPVYHLSGMPLSKNGRHLPHKNLETTSGYTVRVLQWKTSELKEVLQQFLHTCYDLINGKADINRFAQELSLAMDWIVNHCFSLQDVSSMREEIKKLFEWDESQSESEAEVRVNGQVSDFDKRLSSLSTVVASNSRDTSFQEEEVGSDMKEENTKLKDELRDKEAGKKDTEGRLQSDIGAAMVDQIRDCDKSIANLQKELETLKQSRALLEDRDENQKLVENFDRRLTLGKLELSEAPQRSSSVEAELENNSIYCKELESLCHELQHHPDSVTKQKATSCEVEQKEKQPLRTEREITAASEKLAECQETILHLGKQLKALANTNEAALFDEAICNPTITDPTNVSPNKTLTRQRASLLDRMMAEDSKSTEANGKEGNRSSTFISNETIEALEQILLSDVNRNRNNGSAISSAIVPRKKEGIKGLWKKVMWRKKKSNSKKLPLPFAF